MSESEHPPEGPDAAIGAEPEAIPRPAIVLALQPPAGRTDDLDGARPVLERLEARLEESQRLLAHQTDLALSLHRENQRLKAGELRQGQLSLVRDVIRVQDVLGHVLDAAVEPTAATDLQIARDSILDALARNGIEQTSHVRGDPLDPRVHRVVGIEQVDDPAADRTIAEVVKAGFAWEEGTTIRPAAVRVWKHAPRTQSHVSLDLAFDASDGADA